MIDQHHGWNVSIKPLILGLVISLALTFAAFRIVSFEHLQNTILFFTVFSLGIVQALVQLVFFFHLGFESKPYWNIITFLFTALVLIIIVGGSIWIMKNLNYNLMPPMEH